MKEIVTVEAKGTTGIEKTILFAFLSCFSQVKSTKAFFVVCSKAEIVAVPVTSTIFSNKITTKNNDNKYKNINKKKKNDIKIY